MSTSLTSLRIQILLALHLIFFNLNVIYPLLFRISLFHLLQTRSNALDRIAQVTARRDLFINNISCISRDSARRVRLTSEVPLKVPCDCHILVINAHAIVINRVFVSDMWAQGSNL